MYVCMYVCMHACMHACMYVCIYIYICMCIYIYICMWIYIYISYIYICILLLLLYHCYYYHHYYHHHYHYCCFCCYYCYQYIYIYIWLKQDQVPLTIHVGSPDSPPLHCRTMTHHAHHRRWWPALDRVSSDFRLFDNWLVVGPPLWKIWTSIGMMKFPIYGKIKNGNQTTNQIRFYDMFFGICPIMDGHDG